MLHHQQQLYQNHNLLQTGSPPGLTWKGYCQTAPEASSRSRAGNMRSLTGGNISKRDLFDLLDLFTLHVIFSSTPGIVHTNSLTVKVSRNNTVVQSLVDFE